MLPDVLRAEIQRVAATVVIKTLFACHLQWSRGLRTIQKAPKIKGNMSPDIHSGNFTSSVCSSCETATSETSERSGPIPQVYLFSYLSYFHPKFATGTSTVQQKHLRFLLPEGNAYGNDGLGYPLFVFKLHYQLEIYCILKFCIYSSVSKSMKEIASCRKKRQISHSKHQLLPVFRLCEGTKIRMG